MKAVRVRKPGGLDNLYVDSADAPPPGPGEVSVRIRASSLNFHDYLVAVGMIPTPDGRIPMSDGAGEVTAVGAGVTQFKVGDSVVSTFFPNWAAGEPDFQGMADVPGDGADGFARENVTMPVRCFTRTPKGYSHAEAATLTCAGLTAWRALVPNGPVKAGDIVLVQGSGGVSIFALQFAKAMGARVIATSSSMEKMERLKALGADEVLNYKEDEDWGKTVYRMTGGRGADHIVEVGGSGTLTQSIYAARNGGHISIIGVLGGFSGPVSVAAIMGKQLRVQGLTVGNHRQQLDMIEAIEANGIKPVIDIHFPLEQLADAFRHQEANRHFGKICVDI